MASARVSNLFQIQASYIVCCIFFLVCEQQIIKNNNNLLTIEWRTCVPNKRRDKRTAIGQAISKQHRLYAQTMRQHEKQKCNVSFSNQCLLAKVANIDEDTLAQNEFITLR